MEYLVEEESLLSEHVVLQIYMLVLPDDPESHCRDVFLRTTKSHAALDVWLRLRRLRDILSTLDEDLP